MTDQRSQAGKKPFTEHDMAEAIGIMVQSRASGQAGRVAWYLNQGRICREVRRARGYITVSVPRLHGEGRESVTISRLRATLPSEGVGAPVATPAGKGDGKGHGGKSSGSGTDPLTRQSLPPPPGLPARDGAPVPRPSRAPAMAAAAGAAASSTQLRYTEQSRYEQPAATPAGSGVPKTPPRRRHSTPEAAADAPVAKSPRLETTSKSAGSSSSTGMMPGVPQGQAAPKQWPVMGPPPKGYGPRAVPKRPPPAGGTPGPKRSKKAPDYLQTWWRHDLEMSEWGPRYWSYHLRAYIYVNDEGDEYVHIRDLVMVLGITYTENYPWEPKRISWTDFDGRRRWDDAFYPFDYTGY